MRITNKKQRKKILTELGLKDDENLKRFVILLNEDEVRVISPECLRKEFSGLNIKTVGFQIARARSRRFYRTTHADNLKWINPV